MEQLKYSIHPGVTAFSTKRGGAGSYGGFNITHYCSDSMQHVAECRAQLCKELNIGDEQLILPHQTHSCEVLNIDAAFMSESRERQAERLHGIDAVITALPRTCIGVSTADCVPVLLCDTQKRVIAAVHAGWRGTVAGIAQRCLEEMSVLHGCEAQDIKAVIAPSIGCDAFEVGDEVYAAFEEAHFPMEKIATRQEKWHIDLWEANRLQLLSCGIKAVNITVTGICTHSNHTEWFSARRLGIESGRIFNGIMIE